MDAIANISNRDTKLKKFKEYIEQFLGVTQKNKPNVKKICAFITFVVDRIGESDTSTSKPLLLYLSKRLSDIEEDYNEQLLEVCEYLTERMRTKHSYFAESLVVACRLLAELFQADSEWKNAANVMNSVDTADQYYGSVMTIAEQCEWRIQTAEYYLQNEDNTGATKHIQKSRRLLRDVPLSHEKRQELELRHKSCYSRILDSERKFLSAAVNYMEIAQMDLENAKIEIGEEDLLKSLENAVTCAILAKAGGPRTRVLAILFRDERSKNLKNYKVLEKMHKNMILAKKEMDDFAKTLLDHHQATLAGGLTVLQKAVYEHNMLAAAQLYKNIRIEELSKLLGVTDTQAEDLARIMIQEGRMQATIDQVDGILEFENDAQILNNWDTQISETLMSMNTIVDQIEAKTTLQFSI